MAYKPYSSLRRAPLRRTRSLLPTALLVAVSLSPVALFVDFEQLEVDVETALGRGFFHAGPGRVVLEFLVLG